MTMGTVRQVAAAGYPNFPGKHQHEAIFSPAEVVARVREDAGVAAPDAVILTYEPGLIDELEARGVRPTGGYPGPWRFLWFARTGARRIAVAGRFGIGAPAAVVVLEELIALGAREFISIGTAGCLQPRCAFGQAVVCTGAIRDEGVSHHYAPAGKLAWPSPALTARLTGALTADALTAGGSAPEAGLAWTIDAPYRETIAEARSYQAEGVVCVEMEAAALFTVGAYRGVDVAAAFVVSDHLLAEDRWTHAFGSQALRDGEVGLLDAALRALGAAGRDEGDQAGLTGR
jgi:uridine phosphorylase